jgi:hypothetical protein
MCGPFNYRLPLESTPFDRNDDASEMQILKS